MMNEKRKYKWLHEHLPLIKCERCGECCGVIICTKLENDAIKAFIEKNNIQAIHVVGITCLYYKGQECVIYPVRPYVCRMMGHAKDMKCVKGHNRNLRLRRIRRLWEVYRAKLGDPVEAIYGSLYADRINGEDVVRRIDEAKRAYENRKHNLEMMNPLQLAARVRTLGATKDNDVSHE